MEHQTIDIHKYMIDSKIMISERSQKRKRVQTVWLNLCKFLENANQSITESRSVVA